MTGIDGEFAHLQKVRS